MIRRIDAGTDVAMLGAWDAARDDVPLNGDAGALADVLERDAADAHLFLIHTGGDGGGPVDVYVDEDVPAQPKKGARAVGETFLLSVPTGRLVVGGAEDYRRRDRRITGEQSAVDVPPGEYAVRCYAGPDEAAAPSEVELQARVGAAELAWFDRTNMRVLLGGVATLLLFPLLAIAFGWKVALAITLVVFFGYWPLAERLFKRSERYQALDRIVTAHRLANEPAALLLELRPVPENHGLRGGSVRL